MNCTGVTPILNVSNVADSVGWFQRLGWTTEFVRGDGEDGGGEPTYASVCSGDAQLFLCKDGQGLRGGKPPRYDGEDDTGATWMMLWVDRPQDVDAAHARALANGLLVLWPPTDEPWGARECRLQHPDGHTFRIAAALPHAPVPRPSGPR